MYDLSGKVAIVTGAGGEHTLGRAIAGRLAREGAAIVVNDIVERREGTAGWSGLPDIVGEIESNGGEALSVVADVSDSSHVETMVRRTLERFDRIDILVNSAGALAGTDRKLVVELEEDAWDLVQNVNVRGTFLCSRAVARRLIAQDQGGRIINISSTAGKVGVARYAAYCASKFAIRGFTQALAQELGQYGITVNAVCPGLTETGRLDDMAAALAPDGVSPADFRGEMIQNAIRRTPLGRLGQPSDVAGTVAFLSSAEAGFLTGLSVNVAGGCTMD